MRAKPKTRPVDTSAPRTIGMLVYDGVNGLDVIGPLEAFASAAWSDPKPPPEQPYRTLLVGLDRNAVTTESGVQLLPHHRCDDAPPLDTLIVPGGAGLRKPEVNTRAAGWLAGLQARRIATVCTGIYGLAPTGRLDGCRVTTHWRHAEDVAARYPRLRVDATALFIRDGGYYTSGGITAGIDLALALIEDDLGPQAALAVARELLVYLKRPGGQEQFSEPLRHQMRSADRFADLIAWIAAHLDRNLSVEALAARAHLGARQFSRRFAATLGETPARYVENRRLAEACRRLCLPDQTVESVAASVGFASADVLRRAFQRRYGLSPAAYRARFQTSLSI